MGHGIVRWALVVGAIHACAGCGDPLNPPWQPMDASGPECSVMFSHEDGSVVGHLACPAVADGAVSDGSDGGTSCAEISASSYDQTCTGDSDCMVITVGSPCAGCGFQCEADVGAINVGARAQYMGDSSRTPRGGVPCNCPPPPPVPHITCCRSGLCKTDNDCMSPGDAASE